MMTKYIITLFSIGFLIAKSFAHNHDKPVNPAMGIDEFTSPNHAGYGYFGTKSEAQAHQDVQFNCEEKSKEEYLNECKNKNNPTNLTAGLDDLIKKVESERTLEEMRNQTYEYLMIQAGTGKKERPITIETPTCISQPKSELKTLIPAQSDEDLIYEHYDEFNNEQDPVKRKELKEKFELEYKTYSSDNATEILNVMNAVGLFRQLEYATQVYDCNKTGIGSMDCLDLSDQLKRLKNAYPIIFMGTPHEYYQNILKIEKAAKSLLASNQHSPGEVVKNEVLENEGASLWNSRVKSFDWDAMRELDSSLSEVYIKGKYGEYQYDSNGDVIINDEGVAIKTTFASAQSALDHANLELETLKNGLYENSKTRLGNICNLDFKTLAKEYPQVLRQLILDQPSENLAGIKLTICNTPELKNILKDARDRTCLGVSGSLNSNSKTVSINRDMPSFPFYSDQNYSVTKNSNGSLTVNLKINFNQKGTPKLSEEELSKVMKEYEEKTVKFYNDSINGFDPKIDPPTQFKVTISKGTNEPYFNYSKCFNSSLTGDDRYNCEKVQAAGGNWENSANLTHETDDNTIYHEFSHRLGLDDEYEADYYPMNRLGEHDSIMNSGDTLYPRHVQSVIDVALRCGK